MAAEHVTLDTNILVYAVDAFNDTRRERSIALITAAAAARCRLGVQAIGEFYRASTRRLKLSPAAALERANDLLDTFQTFPHSRDALRIALTEATKGRFSSWDAVLLASAEEAGCTLMLSEDMHDGAKLGNITVRNPFGAKGLTAVAKEALGL